MDALLDSQDRARCQTEWEATSVKVLPECESCIFAFELAFDKPKELFSQKDCGSPKTSFVQVQTSTWAVNDIEGIQSLLWRGPKVWSNFDDRFIFRNGTLTVTLLDKAKDLYEVEYIENLSMPTYFNDGASVPELPTAETDEFDILLGATSPR